MKFRVTDDIELKEKIRQAIKENGGYCPCKLEQNENTKCICKEFFEQGLGPCHCGLYIKEEV